jgi:hypothetical protein
MWPFSRKKPPITEPLQWQVDQAWRTGDIAECIRDHWALPADERAPRCGTRHIVTKVHRHEGLTFIALAGYPASDRFLGYGFRKIVLPDIAAERDAGERLPSREMVDG